MATSDTKMTTDMELAEEIEQHMSQRPSGFIIPPYPLYEADAKQIIAALRRGPEPSVSEGEHLWLIERTYAKGEPAERREFWLGGTTDMHNDSFYSGGYPVWTTDALKAARFTSQDIATTLRYRYFHPESTAEVCGHMFQCGISPERPPSGEMVMVLKEIKDGPRKDIIGDAVIEVESEKDFNSRMMHKLRAMLSAAKAEGRKGG